MKRWAARRRTVSPLLAVAVATIVCAPRSSQAAPLASLNPAGAITPPAPATVEPTGRLPLRWDPAWPRFHWSESVATGAALAGVIALAIVGPQGSIRRGGILGDDAVRRALRLGSEGSRRRARGVSDGLLTALVAYPIVVDSLLLATYIHRSPTIGWQMALISTETLAVAALLGEIAKTIGHRERPYGPLCGGERPAETTDCRSSRRYKSFYSGHASMSFASAALTCTNHFTFRLHGSPGDALTCGAGFAAAATTGMLRIVADQHYLSDVVAGAAIGTLVGFGLPWLLHYRRRSSETKPSDGITIQVLPTPFGAAAAGTF